MIDKKQISEITRTIISGYDPEKIYLFGSYSAGNPKEDSDIDLLIIKDTEEPFFNRIRQVRYLFNKQPAPMDIFVYTPAEFELKKYYINHIAGIVFSEGELIYER